jgi:hypothetical protein
MGLDNQTFIYPFNQSPNRRQKMTTAEITRLVRGEVDYWTGERYLNMVRCHARYGENMAERAEAEMVMALQMSWSMLRQIDVTGSGGEWVDGIYREMKSLRKTDQTL